MPDFKAPAVPLNSTHYTAMSFLLAVCIPVLPRHSILRYGLLVLQITCTVQAFIAPPTPKADGAALYSSGVLIGNLLTRYIDRLYTTVPEETFQRISSADPQRPENAATLPPTQRVLWGLDLLSVTRGIGWNWRISSIPPPTPSTRFRFVVVRLLKLVAMYTGLHVVVLTCQAILHSTPSSGSGSGTGVTPGTLHLYIVIVLGCAMTIYSHFGILMLPLSALCVGLQIGPVSWRSPSAWPPNFGSLREAYSIRRFWGRTWHQQLRRQLGAPGAYLVSMLPEAARTSRRRSVRLMRRYFLHLMSFFVSGLVHACGPYQVTRALRLPVSDGGEVRYFVLQGVAIVVEDLVCWVFGVDDRRMEGPGRARCVVGYVVTMGWYVWTRVQWKIVPGALASGIRDERGELFAAVELIREGAAAIPGNFVAKAWEMLRGQS